MKMPNKEIEKSLKQISTNLENINETLKGSDYKDKKIVNSEEWKKRIENLIRQVDCKCKRSFFITPRIVAFVISMGAFIIMVLFLVWLNLAVQNAVLTYAKMLPSGNQTQPNSQLRFLVEQMPSFATLSITISALILAMSTFVLPIFKVFSPDELARYYYGKLSKGLKVEDRPYLKALINMKCKEFGLSLWENYQNCIRLNCDLFSEESLLRSLLTR
jgi:hypothetical protein